IGISGLDVERKVAATPNIIGHHKMSMLQDLEMGRPLELEGMLGVVLELGSVLKLPLPLLTSLYACARLLDESARKGHG
ncbi:MAG: ketopantoate reductase C-terminal domain-containing protein, partial [Dehalococcoidia bacterium]|nr:ketopantoate reductase C-terminal domain-containing protein [Dehalococcoidia bacterium]